MIEQEMDPVDEAFEREQAARRRRWIIAAAVVGFCLVAGAVLGLRVSRRTPGDRGRIVARVNGEPVYAADIAVEVPLGSFDNTVARKRDEKLAAVCDRLTIEQFLKAHQVQVPARDIDRQVDELS